MKILRIQGVISVTGLSRTTVWRLERRGDFPRRLRLSENSCGWLAEEIDDWLLSRPRGMDLGENGVVAHPGPAAVRKSTTGQSERSEL